MASNATRSAASMRGAEPQLGERFADALGYATSVHRGQTRRGSPYVGHLLRVAGLVLEDGGSEDEAIAALLHDAAEDQGGRGRLQDIRARYGDAVAAIVDSCTDSYERPPPPWRMRKERYLEHLPSAPPGALLVSLADKVDNVRGILREVEPAVAAGGRAVAGYEDVCWYYASLADMFVRLRPGARADELARMVGELERATRQP
jgi:(p)ppGpp synthase/HD superfamily hydrolase